MAIELHYGRVSGNSARAALALYEAGCEFHPRLIDTQLGENRGIGYLSINPMGKIPALSDGDFHLWESNAINWYVAEKHPAARLLPASPEGRAAVQRWLLFQTGHVTPACLPIFRATNARVQSFWKTKGDAVAAESARAELLRYLPVIDRALQDREWLEGEFSLADIAFAPHLWLIAEGGYDFAAWPHLRSWIDRLIARPAWLKTAKLIFEA